MDTTGYRIEKTLKRKKNAKALQFRQKMFYSKTFKCYLISKYKQVTWLRYVGKSAPSRILFFIKNKTENNIKMNKQFLAFGDKVDD